MTRPISIIKVYGKTERQMSRIVIPSGTIPFMKNRFMPKGGVTYPITIDMVKTTPNQIGSTPSLLATGKKIDAWKINRSCFL